MIEKQITAKIIYCSLAELSEEEKELILQARSAAKAAYAPYSRFCVGAALLLDNGKIVLGNNQENVSYPTGLCAERVALFAAHARYPEAKPLQLAIAAFQNGKDVENPITPCGACRQVLAESEQRYRQAIKLLLSGGSQVIKIESASALLPLSFQY